MKTVEELDTVWSTQRKEINYNHSKSDLEQHGIYLIGFYLDF